jgi:hypothetical protein
MDANKREKHKGRRKPVKMKTFRTQLKNIRSFREDRIDNQALIDDIKQKNNVITKFKVLRNGHGVVRRISQIHVKTLSDRA